MAKNNGKPSEEAFENIHLRMGKRAYYYRIPDASEVFGRVKKIGLTRPVPSDYILVIDGTTSFAEVKSTQSKTSFPFSILSTGENAAAVQVLAAGGAYDVYVHALALNTWFKVPYTLISKIKQQGKGSIPWAELKDYEWASSTT